MKCHEGVGLQPTTRSACQNVFFICRGRPIPPIFNFPIAQVMQQAETVNSSLTQRET